MQLTQLGDRFALQWRAAVLVEQGKADDVRGGAGNILMSALFKVESSPARTWRRGHLPRPSRRRAALGVVSFVVASEAVHRYSVQY